MHRSGWLIFSAVVLIIVGIMRIFDAIWAFRYNGPVPNNLQEAVFGHSLTTYGWVWLIVGIILIIAGFVVLSPTPSITVDIARWFGIIASAIAAISAVTWMPYYPVWSFIYIAISIVVIYGLAAHQGEDVPAV
jgi:uncharacterized membrane protein HdeD (DUF308 family)